MLPCNDPDRMQIAFDDHCLVANAGLSCLPHLALYLDCPDWLTGTWTWAAGPPVQARLRTHRPSRYRQASPLWCPPSGSFAAALTAL